MLYSSPTTQTQKNVLRACGTYNSRNMTVQISFLCRNLCVVCERESVCVCERERERERESGVSY